MFFPLDIVEIVGNKIETRIVETHVNRTGGLTYITDNNWSRERTEKELSFIRSGGWHLKHFVKEFYPGDRVSWVDNRLRQTDIIEKKIYTFANSRILYKLSCGLVFTASHLRKCEGGI
jgi:hypothetical protein